MTKPQGVLLQEKIGDWLFHTTGMSNLKQIAKTQKLIPGGGRRDSSHFVSLSGAPQLDQFGKTVLVFRKRSIRDRVVEVQYTREWMKKNPRKVTYITSSPFNFLNMDDSAWDEIFADFRSYSPEEEWMTKAPSEAMRFRKGELVAVLCSNCNPGGLELIRRWFQHLLPPKYVVPLKMGMSLIRSRSALDPNSKDPLPAELLKRYGRYAHKGKRHIAASRDD
jgi:hypothetical protein